jgi:hypothetical protein
MFRDVEAVEHVETWSTIHDVIKLSIHRLS